jgi:hypothetical protein
MRCTVHLQIAGLLKTRSLERGGNRVKQTAGTIPLANVIYQDLKYRTIYRFSDIEGLEVSPSEQ